MKFSEGEEVLAKPPNSEDYQKGTVVSVRGDKYRIVFEGGAEMSMHEEDIQPDRPSRSSARTTRARGRKSPSRKSPSRQSPSRKSPSRKSPSRRSPARSPTSKNRKLTRKIIQDRDEDEKESSSVNFSETDQLSEFIPLQSRMRDAAPAAATRRSTRILAMKSDRVVSTRSIDRAVSLPVERKIMYEYLTDNKERGFSVQRDQDLQKLLHYEEEALPDSSTTVEKVNKDKDKELELERVGKPQEWGGWFGALCLTFILPISIILPQVACYNNKCSNTVGFRLPTKWHVYLNLNATLYYTGFLLFVAIGSLLPVGRVVDGQQNKTGRLQYRVNGWLTAIICLAGMAICEYHFNYRVSDYILRSILQLAVSGWIIATILAIMLYIKAGRAPVAALNIYGSTNNLIYDFWQGREINPRIGGRLDIKTVLIRSAIIGALIINSAIVLQSLAQIDPVTSAKNANATVLVVTGLQIFYCLDALVFEATSLTSFRVMYEGTGYMTCVANLLHPFLMTLVTRYVYYQNLHKSPYVLAALSFSFFMGYLIYRMSNNLKDEFRRNPYSAAVSNLETMLTPRGKKLIISGLWGQVRHPNYLGDVIMNWSIAGVSLFTHEIIPYYPVLTLTLVLMHRAYRDHVRCKTRYGTAWSQYCCQVRALIFKRIY
ncbi:delta(14)-sterol reductase [Diachasma alloeum]|uniref:delta(14)-sterol reductase n=1 Tax=Diachasma alloeum TaxID=454923 RepID=UPI000738412E|nr:delta(14)-sterol reductase [Diachasma alloeum]XP_015120863.1 delta(14)-sterol reductase [Diachasma alloeum]XP_015120864.1 delta(14)-sterol reductase [Diachasma alloeum]